MKELKYQELIEILNKHDVPFYDGYAQSKINSEELFKKLDQYIGSENIEEKAVLGMDIYRYGSMKPKAQNLVPLVGQIIRDEAVKRCLQLEESIFQEKNEDYFKEIFINTGDGGYFIFDTPIHALVFAIYFEMTVRLFNSYRLYPKLREILDQSATLRYSMTYDKVYKYENNYYGPGIITNARILSRDKLDRFLIAENVYDWFMRNTNGIDNLQILYIDDIANNIEKFQYLKGISKQSYIFPSYSMRYREGKFKSIDIQKIGEIGAKNQEKQISIYNLHVQYSTEVQQAVTSGEANLNPRIGLTVSLGNLNVSGISD